MPVGLRLCRHAFVCVGRCSHPRLIGTNQSFATAVSSLASTVRLLARGDGYSTGGVRLGGQQLRRVPVPSHEVLHDQRRQEGIVGILLRQLSEGTHSCVVTI